MVVTRELEGGLRHRFRIDTPALVTMQTGANVPRYATMRMLKLARDKPVAEVAAGIEAGAFCAAATHRLSVPPATRARMLDGGPAEVAAAVIEIIREKMGAKA